MTDLFTDGSHGPKVKIAEFGLQKNTDRTVYVKWYWTRAHVKEYKVVWYYSTGNGIAFIGDETSTTHQISTYTAPSNAVQVFLKMALLVQLLFMKVL